MNVIKIDIKWCTTTCQKYQNLDIRTNTPRYNILLRLSFSFLQVNYKHVGMVSTWEYTLTRSTSLLSRNHPTLCFWLRRQGRQMPSTYYSLYDKKYRSNRSQMFLKIGVLNISQHSKKSSVFESLFNKISGTVPAKVFYCEYFLQTLILRNICERLISSLMSMFFDHGISFWTCY